MDQAIEEASLNDPSFASLKAIKSYKWRKKKYDALFAMARYFTSKYVDTVEGD